MANPLIETGDGVYREMTSGEVLAKELGDKKRVFKTLKEAEEYFYKSFDCMSDDPDKENARIDEWIESNEITVLELQ